MRINYTHVLDDWFKRMRRSNIPLKLIIQIISRTFPQVKKSQEIGKIRS